MSGPSPLVTVKHLVRDTFRQACASGIFWIMLAVTAIATLLCLSVRVSGDTELRSPDEPVSLFRPGLTAPQFAPSISAALAASQPLEVAVFTAAASGKVWLSYEFNPELARREGIETVSGRMTLAFGAITVPMSRERADAVRFLELLLGGGLAGALGLLLALIWTAGFVPAFLEPSAAAVLLAKPPARWQLLLGKYLGVLTFVGFQVALFVILTWLALGLRTGVWDVIYWWCMPLLLLQFAIFYSFSVLIAVLTRSTVACVFASVLFWFLGWGINYGSIMARSLPESASLPPLTLTLTDAAYWISPKPIDAGLLLFNALDAQHDFEKPAAFKLLENGPLFSPLLSIVSSLLIAAGLLALAAYEFKETDY